MSLPVFRIFVAVSGFCALLASTGCASRSAPAAAPSAPTERAEARAAGDFEPYREVIPETAASDTGLFVTHRADDKLFYEIPEAVLGKEMLWVSRIAAAQAGQGYAGQRYGNRVVRWERSGDRILLREMQYGLMADTAQPIYAAVQAASLAPVIRSFEIETLGPDDAPVIDVTELFESDVHELSARRRYGARGLDSDRSMLDEVLTFPENIEVRALHTYTMEPNASRGTISALLHHSMVLLPEEPMMPRYHDSRVGYFTDGRTDFGSDEHRAVPRRYIARWRLEKADPDAEVSDPVQPIVWYIDRATPERWRPWLERGITVWQEAFEEAGFSNAIIARQAPSLEDDPTWHPEDSRHSVIRWMPSSIENAQGPSIRDPRSGEILTGEVYWYHNVLNLLRSWYLVQAGATDPRAAQLPLPDSVMGRLIEYVAAHEVGHALGLPHNMKAASSYPVDSLRSRTFTEQYGTTASLMDYARFNYVAQPGDDAYMFPRIGPYDRFSIEWGYRPFPRARTPEEERPYLDDIARRQDTDPMLRFGSADGVDPGAQTEALGDDPVRATEYGMQNIRRIVPMLIDATSQPGEDYSDLDRMYGRLVGQWARELGHVVTVVGGVDRHTKHAGQDGVIHTPVERERQSEAVAFLNEHAFQTPDFLLDEEILRRIEPAGAVERVRSNQVRLLNQLLADSRADRLVEAKAMNPPPAYTPAELYRDVRQGVWAELADGRVDIDPYRRNLQRAHVELLGEKLNGDEPVTSDARPLIRGELRDLDTAVRQALGRSADRTTRLHLEDTRFQIDRILDPR